MAVNGAISSSRMQLASKDCGSAARLLNEEICLLEEEIGCRDLGMWSTSGTPTVATLLVR